MALIIKELNAARILLRNLQVTDIFIKETTNSLLTERTRDCQTNTHRHDWKPEKVPQRRR